MAAEELRRKTEHQIDEKVKKAESYAHRIKTAAESEAEMAHMAADEYVDRVLDELIQKMEKINDSIRKSSLRKYGG